MSWPLNPTRFDATPLPGLASAWSTSNLHPYLFLLGHWLPPGGPLPPSRCPLALGMIPSALSPSSKDMSLSLLILAGAAVPPKGAPLVGQLTALHHAR